MQLNVTGHHVDVTTSMKGYVEKKLDRLLGRKNYRGRLDPGGLGRAERTAGAVRVAAVQLVGAAGILRLVEARDLHQQIPGQGEEVRAVEPGRNVHDQDRVRHRWPGDQTNGHDEDEQFREHVEASGNTSAAKRARSKGQCKG